MEDNPYLQDLSVHIHEGDYLTQAQVAVAFGKTVEIIRQWLWRSRAWNMPNGREPFPAPDVTIKHCPLWRTSTLKHWARRAQVPILGEVLRPPPPPLPLPADTDLEIKLERARAKKAATKRALEAKRAAARAERENFAS